MDIHHELPLIKLIAVEKAKEHNCNYIIMIHNPDSKGNYNREEGSTYEYMAESYFDKPRPNVKVVTSTNQLIAQEPPPQIKQVPMFPYDNLIKKYKQ